MKSSCKILCLALVLSVVLALVVSAASANRVWRAPTPTPDVAMGNVPGLQQYPLTFEQRQRIALIRQETNRQVQEIRRDPTLTPQQREERISQVQQEGHQRILDELTVAQRQEFQQWWEARAPTPMPTPPIGAGPAVGELPEFRQYPLTAEQRQRIAMIQEETQRQAQEIRRDPTLSPQQQEERIARMRHEEHQRVLDVLTDDQRREYQQWWEARIPAPAPSPPIGMGPAVPMGDVPGLQQYPLTFEQRQRIALIRQETQRQVQEIRRDPTLTPQQREARAAQVRQEGHQRVLNELTVEQRREFQQWWERHPHSR